jgi:hypothetical protein
MSSSLPAHLEAIVADVRTATRAAADRSQRRRRRARFAAVALAVLALGAGIAAAAGVDYVGLVKDAYPGAEVTDLSAHQQRVVATISGGTADVIVTDLGVTREARQAPAGTQLCDWTEGSDLLGCSDATGSATTATFEIPAGTHVYRLEPGPSSTLPAPEESVMYVPELRLQLVVEPAGDGS